MKNKRGVLLTFVLLTVLLATSITVNVIQYRTLEAQRPLVETAQSLYNSSYIGLYRCFNHIGTFLEELEQQGVMTVSAVNSLFVETTSIELYTQNLVIFQGFYEGQQSVLTDAFYSAMLRFVSAVNVVADKWEHQNASVSAADKEILRQARAAIEELLADWAAAKKITGVSPAGVDEVVDKEEEQRLREALQKVTSLLEQLVPLD